MPRLTLSAICCTVGLMTADRWTADEIPDLTGRTFVVTGATNGLGRATARALSGHGARLVLGVRNEAAARAAFGSAAEVHRLDLADLTSVRAFAAEVHDGHGHLDVL